MEKNEDVEKTGDAEFTKEKTEDTNVTKEKYEEVENEFILIAQSPTKEGLAAKTFESVDPLSFCAPVIADVIMDVKTMQEGEEREKMQPKPRQIKKKNPIETEVGINVEDVIMVVDNQGADNGGFEKETVQVTPV